MIKITKTRDREGPIYYRLDMISPAIALTQQELKSLHTKIGNILGIVDFKKEMVEDK